MEEMLSECCEAPIFRYEKSWDAGICSECKHVNSVKRIKESRLGAGFAFKDAKLKKEKLDKVHD